jgi:hypothetical protein
MRLLSDTEETDMSVVNMQLTSALSQSLAIACLANVIPASAVTSGSRCVSTLG